MKYLLLLSALLFCFSTSAQSAQKRDWAVGKTTAKVREDMLGEPGFSLEEEKADKEDMYHMTFVRTGGSYGITFHFYKNLCVGYRVLYNGLYQDQIDKNYADLQRIGRNDWVDSLSYIMPIYVHRLYNGKYTEVYIGIVPPEK